MERRASIGRRGCMCLLGRRTEAKLWYCTALTWGVCWPLFWISSRGGRDGDKSSWQSVHHETAAGRNEGGGEGGRVRQGGAARRWAGWRLVVATD